MAATVTTEPERRAVPPLPVAVLGGLLLGVAGLGPSGWPLAWVGVALTAWAVAAERSTPRAVLGLVLGGLCTRVCWFSWSPAMVRAMWPDEPGMQWLVGVGFVALEAAPVIVALVALAVGLRGFRGLVPLWLPVGWVVGERVQSHWTSVSSDWVFTQIDNPQGMEALHLLGLIPLTGVCLFAAASVGAGLALGRRGVVAAGVVAALGLILAPPLPDWDGRLLADIGAVHTPDALVLPAVDRVDGLAVAIWPEVSFHTQPPVAEGAVQNLWWDDAPGGPDTWHLIGVRTPQRYGSQNAALSMRPDGAITQARAKRSLLPIQERPFLGLGGPGFVPGRAVPVLDAAGRRFVALICGEILSHDLVAEGAAAGGQVLVVMARDRYQGGSALADRHVLLKLRLRAIEFGLPAVYASIGGRASFVSPHGEVLARSAIDAPPGVLTWSPQGGPRDHQPQLDPPITVLYDPKTPQLLNDCAPGRCTYQPLDATACPPARTVVVTAHSDGEQVGGLDPAALAERVACFDPELVVLNTCFGASRPVLEALAARTDALVVAVPAFVAARGLRYDAPFYGSGPPETRAAAVSTEPPSPLFVGRPDPAALAEGAAWVDAADGDALRPRVRSWVPTLVAVDVAPGQEVLYPADWRIIGSPPPP